MGLEHQGEPYVNQCPVVLVTNLFSFHYKDDEPGDFRGYILNDSVLREHSKES